MKISDHSLRQLDETYLEGLKEEQLLALSVKLLADLKEAREKLNQNSGNSSRPPSSRAPWERPEPTLVTARSEESEAGEEESPTEATAKPVEKREVQETAGDRRRAGKRVGAPGHGREAPKRIDISERHVPERCSGCGRSLLDLEGRAYTGYYEVDLMRDGEGWQVRWTKHLWQETACECGHRTRAEPFRSEEEEVAVGGFRLVGAGLAALIVALALRYRLSRARIREFLGEWLGVWLSVGTLQGVMEEAGAVAAPAEEELVKAVQQSGLLHADETPWPEQGTLWWLWVFTAASVTLYYISHRGQELVRNLLEGFTGMLMSDGWQAYRWWEKRLRCWAHLKRKAVGLVDSFQPEAQAFGQAILDLWAALWEEIHAARERPPQSLRADWEDRLQTFRTRCEAMRDCPHPKARELAGEFLHDWDAIFKALDDPRWPLTNNEAERALRHWVILRKLSHGTRTERGSRGFALLASIIDTCRQRGHSPWEYLQTAITRRRQGLALLPLPT